MPWVVFLVGALVIFRSPTVARGYRLLMFVVGLLFILAGFVV